MSKLLHSAFTLGPLRLSNRVVMAPMTRCRATADHVPTALMADYYRQRASASHRRHRARARGLGLCPHSRALHAGTRRGLAAGDGRGACRGRTNLRATDAHRQDLASAEHARGRAHYRALRRGPQRLHVDGPAGPAALPGTRRHDRIGHSTRDRSLCPRRGTGDQRGFRSAGWSYTRPTAI